MFAVVCVAGLQFGNKTQQEIQINFLFSLFTYKHTLSYIQCEFDEKLINHTLICEPITC